MIKSNDPKGKMSSFDRFDLDSVAAIIFRSDCRYLLQHRENRPDISYPNKWCLFGGARERNEPAEDALRREMMEELSFSINECIPFLSCTFEALMEGRLTRKIFFAVRTTKREAESMVLREGQGMAWLRFEEILARGHQLVANDLGVIALHYQSLNGPRHLLDLS